MQSSQDQDYIPKIDCHEPGHNFDQSDSRHNIIKYQNCAKVKSQRNKRTFDQSVYISSEKRLDGGIFCTRASFKRVWRAYCFASFDILLYFSSLSLLSLI